MKTQTDVAMIMLALVVAGVIALAVWSGAQVNAAAAAVNAEAAAGQVSGLALIGGQVAGWALSTVIGIVVIAIATGLVAWVRKWWQSRSLSGKRTWRSGPNAQWQQPERGPRTASSDELMRVMLMQQILGGNQKSLPSQRSSLNEDDDLNLDF